MLPIATAAELVNAHAKGTSINEIHKNISMYI